MVVPCPVQQVPEAEKAVSDFGSVVFRLQPAAYPAFVLVAETFVDYLMVSQLFKPKSVCFNYLLQGIDDSVLLLAFFYDGFFVAPLLVFVRPSTG